MMQFLGRFFNKCQDLFFVSLIYFQSCTVKLVNYWYNILLHHILHQMQFTVNCSFHFLNFQTCNDQFRELNNSFSLYISQQITCDINVTFEVYDRNKNWMQMLLNSVQSSSSSSFFRDPKTSVGTDFTSISEEKVHDT